jgi:hypothetical protein
VVERLVAILSRTKDKDTFAVTVAALGLLGTDARVALPDIIENAERLGVLKGALGEGGDKSAHGQAVLQALVAIAAGPQGPVGYLSTVSTVPGPPAAPACVPCCPQSRPMDAPATVHPPTAYEGPVQPSAPPPVPHVPYAPPSVQESPQVGTPAPRAPYTGEEKPGDSKKKGPRKTGPEGKGNSDRNSGSR